MYVSAIKTHKITTQDTNILVLLDKYISQLPEKSIVVIASKIVAITQGRVQNPTPKQKEELIKKEADLFLPKEYNKHGLYITIKNDYLTYSSGIDESNVENGIVLWPTDVQKVANDVREHLQKKFGIRQVGVIITDMLAIPLKWGVIGGALAYSGFNPIKDLRETHDVFGKRFQYTQVGILHALAASAALVMGEGAEQTPLGIIQDIPFVEFQDHNPTQEELGLLKISPEEDLYGPMLTALKWEKGGSGKW